MSSASGSGPKGDKDKQKGTYATLKIPNLYQGSSAPSAKPSASAPKYGLQSLGKVAPGRRVPPPVNIPSLKSENAGSEPNVSLVPAGGAGWGGSDKKDSQVASTSSQSSSVQSQPAPSKQTLPKETPTVTSSSSTSGSSNKLWSSLLGKKKGFLDNDDFPTLNPGEEKPENEKKEEETKETLYGPGPSLRPQNVASWRGGGGRALPQNEPDSVENPPAESGFQSDSESKNTAPHPPPSGPMFPPRMMYHPMMSMPPGVPGMMPRPGMPPPFMMRHPYGMFPPGAYRMPPHFYARPPGSFPYHDARMRPPLLGDEMKEGFRNPIVKDQDLKDMDSLETGGGWWASASGEVDYNEKLVFSDDDDEGSLDDKLSKKERSERKADRDKFDRDGDRSEKHFMKHEDDQDAGDERMDRPSYHPIDPSWQARFSGHPRPHGRTPWEYNMMGYPSQHPFMHQFRMPSQKSSRGAGSEETGRQHRSSRSDDADLAAEYEDWNRDKGQIGRPKQDENDSRPFTKLPVPSSGLSISTRRDGSRESLNASSPSPRSYTVNDISAEKYKFNTNVEELVDDRLDDRESEDINVTEIKQSFKDLSVQDDDQISKEKESKVDKKSEGSTNVNRYNRQALPGKKKDQSRHYDELATEYEKNLHIDRSRDDRYRRDEEDKKISRKLSNESSDRRGKGQVRLDRGDRPYSRGLSWEDSGYSGETDEQPDRRPKGGDRNDKRSDDRERRRKIPSERQQSGRKDEFAHDGEKPKRETPGRRQHPRNSDGDDYGGSDSRSHRRAYDEREFEDISESGSRLSKDTKIERFSTNEQDIEVGSVEEPDVQIFRTRVREEIKAPPPILLEGDEPEHCLVPLKRTHSSTSRTADVGDKSKDKDASQLQTSSEASDDKLKDVSCEIEDKQKTTTQSVSSTSDRSKNSGAKEERRPMANLSKKGSDKLPASTVDDKQSKLAVDRAEKQPTNVWKVKASIAKPEVEETKSKMLKDESLPKEIKEFGRDSPVVSSNVQKEELNGNKSLGKDRLEKDGSIDEKQSGKGTVQREGSHEEGLSPPKKPKEEHNRSNTRSKRQKNYRGGNIHEDNYAGLEFVRSSSSQQQSSSRSGYYDDYTYVDEYTNWSTSGRGSSRSGRGSRERGSGGRRQQNSAGQGQYGGSRNDQRVKEKVQPKQSQGEKGSTPASDERKENSETVLVKDKTDSSSSDKQIKPVEVVATRPNAWNIPTSTATVTTAAESSVWKEPPKSDPPNAWKIPINEKPKEEEKKAVEQDTNKKIEQSEEKQSQKPRGGSRGRGRRRGTREHRDVYYEQEDNSYYRQYSDSMFDDKTEQGAESRHGPSQRGRDGSRRGNRGNSYYQSPPHRTSGQAWGGNTDRKPSESRESHNRSSSGRNRRPYQKRTSGGKIEEDNQDFPVESGEMVTVTASPLTRPHLAVTKQSSSDVGNEEWETASESSDVLEIPRVSKNGLGQEAGPPAAMMINGRGTRGEVTRTSTRHHPNDEWIGNGRISNDLTRRRRGLGGRGRVSRLISDRGDGRQGRPSNFVKEKTSFTEGKAVPTIEEQKSSTVKKTTAKAADAKEQVVKKEKPKKSLDNIDFTNIASVVIVDNQMGLEIIDPNASTDNDGFQEVMSRRAKSKQQKAQVEISIKKAMESQTTAKSALRKNEVSAASSSETGGKPKRQQGRGQLPPRLQGSKVNGVSKGAKVPSKAATDIVASKGESWEDEIEVPITGSWVNQELKLKGWDGVIPGTIVTSTSIPPTDTQDMTSRKWMTVANGLPSSLLTGVSSFVDKAEHQDSGIDVTDIAAQSGTSSVRSSPADQRPPIENATVMHGFIQKPQPVLDSNMSSMIINDSSGSSSVVGLSEHSFDIGRAAVVSRSHKNRVTSSAVEEAIQLPASFKTQFSYGPGEGTAFPIEFTFDESLAQLDEKKDANTAAFSDSTIANTSALAPEYDRVIASVKGVWSSEPSISEMFSSQASDVYNPFNKSAVASASFNQNVSSVSSHYNSISLSSSSPFTQSSTAVSHFSPVSVASSQYSQSQTPYSQSQQYSQTPVVFSQAQTLYSQTQDMPLLHFSQSSVTPSLYTQSGTSPYSSDTAVSSHYSSQSSSSHFGGSVVTVSYTSDSPLTDMYSQPNVSGTYGLNSTYDMYSDNDISGAYSRPANDFDHSSGLIGGDTLTSDVTVTSSEYSSLPEIVHHSLMDDIAERLTAAEQAANGGCMVGDDDVTSTLTAVDLQYPQTYSQPSQSVKVSVNQMLSTFQKPQRSHYTQQQQQQQSYNMAPQSVYYETNRDYSNLSAMAGSGISSPPSSAPMLFAAQTLSVPQYHPFQMASAPVIPAPDQKSYMAPNFAFSLVAPQAQGSASALGTGRAYSQILPDMYQTGSQATMYRSNVSQASSDLAANNSSLITGTMKATLPASYVTGNQKTTGMGSTTFQPGGVSAVYLPLNYDVGQPINQHQPASANVQNTSHLLPAQYLQRGSALPAMQPMANQSTYYTPGPPSMQQTGYYPTQLGSSSLQQVAPTGQYQLSAVFGQSLNLQLAAPVGGSHSFGVSTSTSQLNKMATPFQPANATSQNQQVKPLSMGSAFNTISQTTTLNKPQQQAPPQSAFGLSTQQTNRYLDASAMFGNGMRSDHSQNKMMPSSLGQPSFSVQMANIVGQPVNTVGYSLQTDRSSIGGLASRLNQQQQSVGSHHVSASVSQHSMNSTRLPFNSSSSGNIGLSNAGTTQTTAARKAELEKQKKEALQLAQDFLNPQKKPAPRVSRDSSAENLTSSSKETTSNSELISTIAQSP